MELNAILLLEIIVVSLIGDIELLKFLPSTLTCRRSKTDEEKRRCGNWGRAKCIREKVEECCRGYRAKVSYIYGTECIPVCDNICENGQCVSPNYCQCYPGYKKYSHYGKCMPVCSNGCMHGNCLYPERCICNDGYVMENNKCEPICTDGCQNSQCIEPNVCACNTGYEMVQNKCEPICADGCQNGQCVEPNVCACNAGYEMIQHKCEPTCTNGCQNGKCEGPERCTCNAGYEMVQNKCIPVCTNGCQYGKCDRPEVCTCYEGYILIENKCEPICFSGCQNGKCIEPELCSCNPGYKVTQYLCTLSDCGSIHCLNDTSCSTCEPECTGCDDGTCVEPDNCIFCPDGFVYSAGDCNEFNCTANTSCIPIDDLASTTTETISWAKGFQVASPSSHGNESRNMSSTENEWDETVTQNTGNVPNVLQSDTENGHLQTDQTWIVYASSGAAPVILILILWIVIWKRGICSKGRYLLHDTSGGIKHTPVIVFSSTAKNEDDVKLLL